jgi:isoleucyl-tRNA synthetase
MPYASAIGWASRMASRRRPGFPAQFIAEGLDQTRGWFYTLLVLSTALFDKPAFQNVVVNGWCWPPTARRCRKLKKNYPDPNAWSSRRSAPTPARLSDRFPGGAGRADELQRGRAEGDRAHGGAPLLERPVVLHHLCSVDGLPSRNAGRRCRRTRPEIDRWILSVLHSLVRDVNREMEAYRLYNVVPRLVAFIDDLTTWYIRRSRPRFWKNADRTDQAAAYATLYAC